MKIRGLKGDLLDLLLEIGNARHPYEFAGLLLESDGVIDELNLLPGTVSGEASANLFLDMMPLSTHVAGSVHSHPSGNIRPSDADISFFSRSGRYHIIVGYPYTRENWQGYRVDGTPYTLEVIS
jgi:proteasome lid subunit RPN8/RPN11